MATATKGQGQTMDDNSTVESENAAIIRAAEKYLTEDVIEVGENDRAIVLPSGKRVESLKPIFDQYRTAPERKRGTAKLTSLDSFVDHVNRHKDGNTVIFASEDPRSPGLTAVFDYNEQGPTGAPRFGQHRAHYPFPLSDEWIAWMKAAANPMSQAAFADFLEDRIVDVLDPTDTKIGDSITDFAAQLGIDLASPQRLMTLARGLSVNVNATVKNSINLTSGEGQIAFSETHVNEQGVTLRVPGGFAIGIPVFRLGIGYQIPVRMRYRVSEGKVTWTVGMQRTDHVFADAIAEAAAKAKAGTELPLFFGAPEA